MSLRRHCLGWVHVIDTGCGTVFCANNLDQFPLISFIVHYIQMTKILLCNEPSVVHSTLYLVSDHCIII